MMITNWFPDNRISINIRGKLISIFLPGKPKNLTLGRDVTLLGINKLIIGSNVYLAKGVWINALGNITIKDEVILAPYVVVTSTKHGFKNGSVYGGGTHYSPVIIGRETWVASHSTIPAVVSVVKGYIIAANSVVVKNTRNNVVVSGVPAIEIAERKNNPGFMGNYIGK